MKKLFALLLFLMVPFAPVCAQGLHRKILIVRDSALNYHNRLVQLLPSIYSGEVDTMSDLPSDLSNYDAIFLFGEYLDIDNYPSPPDTLSCNDELSLISYLQQGGRFYAEGPFSSGMTSIGDTVCADRLWRFLGMYDQPCEDIEVYIDSILGVNSAFTSGIAIYSPTSVGCIFEPEFTMIPVLYAQEDNPGGFDDEDDPIAWIPADSSIKAVLYYTEGVGYDIFLTHVLCDYFGLCVDAVKEAPQAVPTATLRVMNDGVSTSLVVSSEESGTLDVANALGVTVYRSSVNSGASSIELPESLRNGVYFARLQTEHGGQVQPFAIVAR
jgi:hypothetical protein